MFDYRTIDLSPTADAEKHDSLAQLREDILTRTNPDAVAIFQHSIDEGVLEVCARTNDVANALGVIGRVSTHTLIECVMQAAARGHMEVLDVLIQHTSEPWDRVHGLEAAAYFNQAECAVRISQSCLDWKDCRFVIKKGLNAAIEGNNFELAHQLMPYIDATQMHSAMFRFAVRDGQQETAELYYPYSDIADMLNYITNNEDSEDVQKIVQWIEEYESAHMAQRINQELAEHTVSLPKTVKKI